MNTLNEISSNLNNDPNFNTTMVNLLSLKSTINNSILTGITTIPNLTISSSTLPIFNTTDTLINKKYTDDTFVKLGSNNVLTGIQNFNNNLIIGDGVGNDTMTINANIITNSTTLTPVQLSKVQYLSNTTSDVNSSLNLKAPINNSILTGITTIPNLTIFKFYITYF